MNETKKITIDFTSKKEKKESQREPIKPKEKIKRIITNTEQWCFEECDLTNEKQLEYINQIVEGKINVENQKSCDVIIKQLKRKIVGYRSQDVVNKKLNRETLVDLETVLKLLYKCENKCYYCQNSCLVLYEYVRDRKQWSLERKDNSIGHNKGNLDIACLECNVRRKTMNQERYVFTKQMSIVKKE
jgi:hypothetical protein